MDQSLSRSVADNDRFGTRHLLIQGKYAKIDFLFPLFDQMVQLCKIPSIISSIFAVFYCFQLVSTSLWISSDKWYNESIGINTKSLSIISSILWFINSPPTDSGLLAVFLITIVFGILTFLLYFTQVFFYVKNRRFFKWGLFTARFFIECLTPILTYISSVSFNASLYFLIQTKKLFYWAYIIVSFMLFIYFFIVFIYGNATIMHSSCITFTAFSAFDMTMPTCILSINCLANLFSNIFYGFPLYTLVIFIIVHLISFVFVYYILYITLPYHHKRTNIIHSSVVSTEILTDICFIFMFLSNDKHIILGLTWPLIFFIVSVIVNYFLFRHRYKIIGEALHIHQEKEVTENAENQENQENPPEQIFTENDFHEYYKGLGLDSSQTKAITYMHVGFTEMCEYFLNWSLTRYIVGTYKSTSAICSVIQLISFFPSEFRQLNNLFSLLSSRTDLSFANRFLIYQVYRIKTLRQSSSSSDANDRLSNLRSLTERCISFVHSFWRTQEANSAFFEVLAREEHRVNSLWLETIRDYPNSAKLCDEYATFLIECVADYHNAVVMKQKAEMIEQGNLSFAIDASFRSLIWSYPAYMKRGFIDKKGNILKTKGNIKSSSSSTYSITGQSSNVSEIVESETSLEFQERHAFQILTKSRLRLAADLALKKRSHPSFSLLPFWAAVSFVVSFLVYICLYFDIESKYFTRRNSVKYTDYLCRSHFRSIISNVVVLFKYLYSIDKFDPFVLNQKQEKEDDFIPNFITAFDDFNMVSLNNLNRSRVLFNGFLTQVTDLIDSSKDNIYPLVERLIGNTLNITFCRKGRQIASHASNMKEIISYSFYLIYVLTMEQTEDQQNYLKNNPFCESNLNQMTLMEAMTYVYDDFLEYTLNRGKSLSNINYILKIICPLILFIFSFLPYLLSSVFFVFHADRISLILSSLDRQVKENAILPIRKDVEISWTESMQPHISITEKVWITIILFIFALAQSLLCYGMLEYTNNSIKDMDLLSVWTYYSAHRLSASIDLFYMIFYAVILNDDNMSTFLNRRRAIDIIINSSIALNSANLILLKGTDEVPSFYGFDSVLDDINFKEECIIDGPTRSFHESYRCGSADRLVSSMEDLLVPIAQFPKAYNGTLKEHDDVNEFIHLFNSHLFDKFVDTCIRIDQLAEKNYDDLVKMSLLFLLLGLIMAAIVFMGGFILKTSSASTYRAIISQIKHIPPYAMVADKDLKNFLLSKNDEKSSAMTVSRNIIHKSEDATFIVSSNGDVEMVNPAITSVLGFTPEQVLGQSILSLFTEEVAEQIENQMIVDLENQKRTVHEDHVTCVTDSGEFVPVHLTLIQMQYEDNTSSCGYVFILRNESNLIKRQKAAEEAKMKSENLLYHILPQDIVMRINQGEKDICFTVPNATIIFIDVVKFSEYAKNLSPQEIMGTLTTLFSAFDSLLHDYNLLLKIKLIGDVYMAAAGLFNNGENPNEHANQTVKFAIDCLNSIDDINVKLNSNLSVRVGVNTDGPLIAGVLGTDKPVFDIIGDTINVASRLQSTDIPGKIQIIDTTYKYLNEGEYIIEPRGEVYLKGKGKFMTYLISPDAVMANIQ